MTYNSPFAHAGEAIKKYAENRLKEVLKNLDLL